MLKTTKVKSADVAKLLDVFIQTRSNNSKWQTGDEKEDKQLEILADIIDEEFKRSAIKAAQEMPKQGELNDRCKFVYDTMKRVHPNIAWGVQLQIASINDLACQWYSMDAKSFLYFRLRNIFIMVFELKMKNDEQSIKD